MVRRFQGDELPINNKASKLKTMVENKANIMSFICVHKASHPTHVLAISVKIEDSDDEQQKVLEKLQGREKKKD